MKGRNLRSRAGDKSVHRGSTPPLWSARGYSHISPRIVRAIVYVCLIDITVGGVAVARHDVASALAAVGSGCVIVCAIGIRRPVGAPIVWLACAVSLGMTFGPWLRDVVPFGFFVLLLAVLSAFWVEEQ